VSDLQYREAGTPGDPAVLLVHGYPESSYMWRDILPALAEAGFHALAPDLAGYGDSPLVGEGTWERHISDLEAFRVARGLDRVALVLHDWGGLIGLRWACEHPDAMWALVISDTGFFSDGKWHGMAKVLRTPGDGEQAVEAITQEGLAQLLGSVSRGIDAPAAAEYFKAYATPERRQGQLDLYRSGDFEKLAPYEHRLAALDVPTLLLWGAEDPFAPVAGAQRLRQRIPEAELVVVDGSGHFVFEDEPARCAREVVRFLGAAARA
jgi:haloalkane dehalogenase